MKPSDLIGKEDPQLGLFEQSSAPTVDLSREEELLELSRKISKQVRFGTSSWTFPGWAGLVYNKRYPTQQAFVRDSLQEYAAHPLLTTVGVDRGYYSPIPEEDLLHYAKQLPDSFPCVVKLPQQITAYAFPDHKRYGASAGMLNPNFLDADLFDHLVGERFERAFKDHVGAFVVEIPQTRAFQIGPDEFAKMIRAFLSKMPSGFDFSFELRESKLLTTEYFAALRDFGATHVYNHWSRMPRLLDQHAKADRWLGKKTVVRLLLPPGGRYQDLNEAYTPFDRVVAPDIRMRDDVLTLIRYALERESEVLVIVNNKAEGSSPGTIEALARRLAADS